MDELIFKIKIFGVGLPKSGTTSIRSALRILGFKSYGANAGQNGFILKKQLLNKNFKLKFLNKFNVLYNFASAVFYKELDQVYPNSKFILNIRDKELWLASSEKWFAKYPGLSPVSKMLFPKLYGCRKFNKDKFSAMYDKHIENVLIYFADRPQDLLVINVCNGDGWEKLCPFFGLDQPNVEFPWENKNRGKKRSKK